MANANAAGTPTRIRNPTTTVDEDDRQVPKKQFPPRALPAGPSCANVAFLRQHAVEQDEPHHAADVGHHKEEDERGNDEDGDAGRRVSQDRFSENRAAIEMARRSDLLRDIEAADGEIAAASEPISPASSPTNASRVHCQKRNGWTSCRLVCWNARVIVSTAEIGKVTSSYCDTSKVLRSRTQGQINSGGRRSKR